MARARDEALRAPGGPDALAPAPGKALGNASDALARSRGCSSASVEGAGSMAAGAAFLPAVRPGRRDPVRGARQGPRQRPRRRRLRQPGCPASSAPLSRASPPHRSCPGRPPSLLARSSLNPEPQRAPRTHRRAHHVARRRPPVCAGDRGRALHRRPGAGSWAWDSLLPPWGRSAGSRAPLPTSRVTSPPLCRPKI